MEMLLVKDDSKEVAADPGRYKSIALVIAIFLGHWTWLYTWRTDKFRFLAGLAAQVLLIISAVFGRELGVDDGAWTQSFGLAVCGIWLWAVVLAFLRPSSFYELYD